MALIVVIDDCNAKQTLKNVLEILTFPVFRRSIILSTEKKLSFRLFPSVV
jgi:hypothetical protein